MIFSALLVLAAALPSNYVMKQEKELLKDVLQYLENAQTNDGIVHNIIIIVFNWIVHGPYTSTSCMYVLLVSFHSWH